MSMAKDKEFNRRSIRKVIDMVESKKREESFKTKYLAKQSSTKISYVVQFTMTQCLQV